MRFIRRFFVVLGIASAVGVVVLAVYIVLLSTQIAEQTMRPPVKPMNQLPSGVGIRDYQDVTFTTRDGVRLSGWYVAPQAQTGKVILFAHGYAHNREMLLPEAGVLAAQGFGVLLFDFRGHGKSDPALVTLGDQERLDLRAAVDFISGQPGIRYIGAVGFSMGAATLAVAAAEDPRIRAVVLEAAFPALDEELYFRARLFGPLTQIPALLKWQQAGVKIAEVSPLRSLCAISPRPVLLVYGTLDDQVPPGTAAAMAAAACPPFELWQVTGAGHESYADFAPSENAARLVRFFSQ